jgi:hypothetical protein
VTAAAGIFEELMPEHLHYLMIRGIIETKRLRYSASSRLDPSFWNMPASFR